jgi:hypothetical protein
MLKRIVPAIKVLATLCGYTLHIGIWTSATTQIIMHVGRVVIVPRMEKQMEPARANTGEVLSNYQGNFHPAQDRNQPGTTLEEDRNHTGNSNADVRPLAKQSNRSTYGDFDDFFQTAFQAKEDRNQPGTTLEPVLSLKEAVEFYKISEKTIRLHIGQGKIAARKEQGPRGLEWRIYPGGFPSQTDAIEAVIDQDEDRDQIGTTLEEDQNQDGTTLEVAWNHPGNEGAAATTAKATELDKLIEIIQVQGQKLEDANKKLESANYRIGYLEAQTQNYQEQIKLLTDSQHKAGWWSRFCCWFVWQGR